MIEIEELKQIVRSASEKMVTDHYSVSQKDGYANIVTSSDVAVQDYLCSRLAEALPGCGFLCEEDDMMDTEHEYTWIIDPIDGTCNYSRGIDQCAVCVGLSHNGRMEMSVVYLPRTGEMFHAELGKGAYLNGKPIHVSGRPFGDAVLCSALSVYHKQYARQCSEIILDCFMQCNDVRRFGAAAPELCYLAMGRCELYFEYLLSAWDFAAASLILTEAGGCIAVTDGTAVDPTRHSGIVAANSRGNLDRMLGIITRHTANQQ